MAAVTAAVLTVAVFTAAVVTVAVVTAAVVMAAVAQLHIRHGDEVMEVSGVVNRMPMAYLDGGDANGHERVPSPEVRSLIDIDGREKRSGGGEIQKIYYDATPDVQKPPINVCFPDNSRHHKEKALFLLLTQLRHAQAV